MSEPDHVRLLRNAELQGAHSLQKCEGATKAGLVQLVLLVGVIATASIAFLWMLVPWKSDDGMKGGSQTEDIVTVRSLSKHYQK